MPWNLTSWRSEPDRSKGDRQWRLCRATGRLGQVLQETSPSSREGSGSVGRTKDIFTRFQQKETRTWRSYSLTTQTWTWQACSVPSVIIHMQISPPHRCVRSLSKWKTPASRPLNHFKSLQGHHQQLETRARVNHWGTLASCLCVSSALGNTDFRSRTT